MMTGNVIRYITGHSHISATICHAMETTDRADSHMHFIGWLIYMGIYIYNSIPIKVSLQITGRNEWKRVEL